jgi:hypothetical protein
MEFIGALWLPILVAGVVAFVLSALVWTVLPHHKGEWQGLAGEDRLLAALRENPPRPGLYTFPFHADPRQRDDPALKAKIAQGPVGYLTIVPNGAPAMGPMMVRSLLFNLVVSLLVAYVAWHALGAGAPYLAVFRIVGTVAAMSYILGTVPESIWFGRPWNSFLLQAVDGLLYGLFTAGVFGWLWPR